MMPLTDLPRAGLFRRLAALVYDVLIVAGILFIASALSMGFVALVMGITDSVAQAHLAAHPLNRAFLFACWFGYYGLSWTKSGQTIGMKAWNLQVRRLDGHLLTWIDAVRRFGAGFLGLANLSLLLTRSGLALHDQISLTEVLQLPKRAPAD